MIGLTDRTAIVTGAAKGIGEAIALALSSAGARVVIADVDEEAGAAVADRLGSDVAAFARCDVSRAGAYGIRVNAIAPGIILTPIYEATYLPGIARKVLGHQAETQQPLRKLGLPEDVAGTALWLASDLSAFVTGQTIAVDGGYSSFHRGALEAGFARLQEELENSNG